MGNAVKRAGRMAMEEAMRLAMLAHEGEAITEEKFIQREIHKEFNTNARKASQIHTNLSKPFPVPW